MSQAAGVPSERPPFFLVLAGLVYSSVTQPSLALLTFLMYL